MGDENKNCDYTLWWGVGLIAFSCLVLWLFFF